MGAAVHLVFAARGLRRDGPNSVFAPSSPLICPCCPRPPVFPNLYLGHGAAPPGAIRHSAACGGVGALEMAVGTLDGTHGVGFCGWGDPGFHQPSRQRSLLPSLKELLAAPGNGVGVVFCHQVQCCPRLSAHPSPTSLAWPQQSRTGRGTHCLGWP